jgi:outer membrane protein assembly factor BamB
MMILFSIATSIVLAHNIEFNYDTCKIAMFCSNNMHNGVYKDTIKPYSDLKWKFKTNGKVYGSPVVMESLVFVGSEDSCMYALNKMNGAQVWKFKTNGPIHSTPLVVSSFVCFGSLDGIFYCLDKSTGSVKWKFKTHGDWQNAAKGLWGMSPASEIMKDNFDFFCSSPVVFGRKICFGAGKFIFALNIETGSEIWEYKTMGLVHSSPACDNGKVFCGSWDGTLYCLDTASGKLVWKCATTYGDSSSQMTGILSSPTIDNGKIFFGTREGLFHCVNESTGKELWRSDMSGSWILNTAAIYNGTVLFGTSDTYLLDFENESTGIKKSSFNTGLYEYSSPAISNGIVYVGSFNGFLYAVDMASKKPVWVYQVESSKLNLPTYISKYFDSDVLNWDKLVGYKDEALYSTNTYGVQTLLKLGSIVSSPFIDNGVVYFSSADSCVYALYDAGNPRH